MSKVFVLRTHALLSSRESTLKFGNDNEIVIPFEVLKELRHLKHESTEKKKIAKDLLRYILELPTDRLMSKEGVVQENGSILRISRDYKDIRIDSADDLTIPQKRTLQICLGIRDKENKTVILVTNNEILQLEARNLGIKAESFKDETFPRLKDQYTGREEIYTTDACIDTFFSKGFINKEDIYEYQNIEFVNNKFFVLNSESKTALATFKNGKIVKLKYQEERPFDIRPQNVGQKFLVEALFDEDCPLVIAKGNAGTGKTFCSLAVALHENKTKEYDRILVTRSVTATEQYGYLPGDIDQKLGPYLAGIKDNLAILINGPKRNREGAYEDGSFYFEKGIIQIQPIGFLRGRSIVNSYFIIDETQNIEPDTIKSIVTRAGEGSKFIFLGDPTQIDNPNLNERYNGLVYLSEKMKGNPMCVQVSLTDNESVRSDLAREAAKLL